MKRIGRPLRNAGRVITIIGLLLFYGSIFFAFAVGFGPPTALTRAALVLPAVGCVLLITALLQPRDYKGRVAAEVALGILCVPPGLVALFEASGGDLARGEPFWVIVTIFLLPGAIALIVQSARTSFVTNRMRTPAETS